MNSDYIKQKRPVLHGSTCPLNAIRTDTNVTTTFRNFYAKDMSPLIRRRIFEGYKDFSSMTGVNRDYLTYIAKELLDPFVGYSHADVQDRLNKDVSSALELSRPLLREQLKNLFKGMKKINVVIDNGVIDNSRVGAKPSIKFMFDYPYSSLENGPLQDPLKATWSSGIVTFAGGDDVTVTAFIPVQRIREVIQESFSKVASTAQCNVTDVSVSTVFQKAREILTDDITNAIISGVYVDRFRENLMAQVKALFAVISKFVTGEFSIPNPDADSKAQQDYNNMVNGFVQALVGKYLDSNSLAHPAIPSLNEIIDKTYTSMGSIQIHPWQIYNLFARFTDIEVNALLKQLHSNITGIVDGKYDRDHTISLDYLEHEFENDHADAMSACLQISRTLPFTLLAIFVYGQGSKIGNYMRYITNVKEFVKSLNTVANTSLNMRNLNQYIAQINGYIEYADTVLSNPRLPEYLDKILEAIKMK